MARRISLDQLTVLGVTPPEMVDIAADLGYDLLGPIFSVGANFSMPVTTLERGHPLTVEMAARLKASGVAINNMDGFVLVPDMDLGAMQPMLELSAELGARNVVTLAFDPETGRAFDNFCRLAESARACGLGVVLEFYPHSFVRSLDEAVAWIGRAGQSNARILVDALHLNQSGGTPDDIRRVDPALIDSAQICDGPLKPTMEQYAFNALNERGIPGTGDLPLVDFIAALPAHATIGVEIPLKSLADQGVSHKDRARRCLEATLTLIAQAESRPT